MKFSQGSALANKLTRKLIFFPAVFLFLLIISASNATEPVSLIILTLDTRPPNNLFLKELAAVAGIDVTVSFDPAISSSADLISINASVAGSLVGSRSADPWTLDPPVVKPGALLHFAVPRIEPTVLESGMSTQYSHVREMLSDPDLQRHVLDAISGDGISLGDPFLDNYVIRMKGWLDFLLRAGYDPDRLLITLDDNRPGPLSDGLKLLLGRYSLHVHDGTDEGMMLLLARALRERQTPAPTTCGVIWTDPSDMVSVMPFEGGMVAENVLGMSDWLKFRITPRIDLLESWRPVLWINGAGLSDETRANEIRDVCVSLGDQPVIVADIAKTNMGDSVLIDTWRDGMTPPGLIGYVGWNTSSNTLGSALALWTCIDFAYTHGADPEGVRGASETFLWARFLDDYIYQSTVRPECRNLLTATGGDSYHLTPEQVEQQIPLIASMIVGFWRRMGEELSLPLRYVDPINNTKIIVELPWSRLFEIALYPTDARGILPVIHPVP
jgi:hypothetical protein